MSDNLPALPEPDFIRKTNAGYAAWCATYYDPSALDERGMASLHGLWAWQEQESRIAAAVAAERSLWQEDAERYRLLRQDFSPMGLNIDGNHSWAYRRNFSLIGPNLDEAIDKARTA